MTRGDVFWCLFEEPDKSRPALILTRTPAISFLNSVSVAPLTRTVRDIPSFVFLDEDDGMPSDCCINLDAIQTITKARVGEYITTLSQERLLEVQAAIEFALGFTHLEDGLE